MGSVSITGTATVAGTVSVSNLPAVGQLAMAASLPVVIASNQSAVTVDGSGVTQPISASALPLPSGASTEASLAAMSAKLPASLGQKANSSSLATCRSNTAGAYDLSGRTTIATASTSTKLLCDSDGHLQVDILSGGGGDATAANQVIQETTLDAIEVLQTAGNAILSTIDTDTGAMVVDLAAIEISNAAIKVATEASAVDLAAIEVLQTAANVDLAV